jgi:DNA modification methylase
MENVKGLELNKIYNESNLETMAKMPDCFIDLTVTSPPYDGLRDYNGFSFPFEEICQELFRITKDGGIVVWVVGDAVIDGSETGTSFKQALYFMQCGFNLHDTMIYEKNGPAYPASSKSNRYSQVFEYMFIFSKGKPKCTNLIKDRKNRWGGENTFGKQSNRKKDGELQIKDTRATDEMGYRFNIWKYNNGFGYSTKDEIAFNHPAIFPEQLAADHINTWSNEGEIVYEPFCGSGTTPKVAIALNRKWVASEISAEYVEIANKRLQQNFANDLFISF